MLQIQLFGDFRLFHNEKAIIGVAAPRLRSLLAYLLLHRGASQSRQLLAYQFWPDSSETQARTNLRKLLLQLRQALPDSDAYLSTDDSTIQWRGDLALSLDVDEFERAMTQAGTPDRAEARCYLERAIALYQGDLLPECYDDWIIPERDRLRQMLTGGLRQLAGQYEEQRAYTAAINAVQRLLRLDELDEDAYRALMRLHALNGNLAQAMRVYHNCVIILSRELNAEPSPATRELHARLLRDDRLADPIPSSPTLVATAYRRTPFVGRQTEWTRLQAIWETTSGPAGTPHLVLLAGEAGIGKSKLAEQLLQWASRLGHTTAVARCQAIEGALAYAPVVEWLRTVAVQKQLPGLEDVWLTELARILPELLVLRTDLPVPGPLTEGWQRQRLHEALARAFLSAAQPAMAMLDDLQWCDRETLAWLHYLLRFDPKRRLLIVATVRCEELSADHPLQELLTVLRRAERVTEIDLGRFSEQESRELAALVAGCDLTNQQAARIYAESEGNPLFVVEMIRSGNWHASGALSPGTASNRQSLSPNIQAIVNHRLAQLSARARDLVGLAATIGRSFTFDVLAKACEWRTDVLVQALDELWQRRILREQSESAYDFTHDKIREVAYSGLSAARRRLLHRQAAEALQAQSNETLCAQVAAHFERAGLPLRAIPMYQRAAEVSRRLYANEEALRLFNCGLALFDTSESVGRAEDRLLTDTASTLCEGLGDTLNLVGRYEKARVAYQRALGFCTVTQGLPAARFQRKIAATYGVQHNYAAATQAYAVAEAILGTTQLTTEPALREEYIEIQADRMALAYWLGQPDQIDALIQTTRPLVEHYGTAAQRARLFEGLQLLSIRRSRFRPTDETIAYIEARMAALQQAGDMDSLAMGVFQLGFIRLWHGDLEVAKACLCDALDMSERTGNVLVQTRTLNYLACLCRMRGQVDETEQWLARSMPLAERYGFFDYLGHAYAHLAWINLRRGLFDEAEKYGLKALAKDELALAVMIWMAILPLAEIAMHHADIAAAVKYVRLLSDPSRMRLPDEFIDVLTHAVAMHDRGADATSALQHALALAQKLGYL